MANTKLPKKERRLNIVNLRFSELELAEIKKHMKEHKINKISPFIRRVFLSKLRSNE